MTDDLDFAGAAPPPGSWEERIRLPFIQFFNMKKGMDGINKTGGYFCADQLVPQWEAIKAHTEAGEELVGFGGQEIEAAILCHRGRWMVKDSRGKDQIFFTYHDAKEQLGEGLARTGKSHVQIALWLRGADGPAMLSLRGMASDGIQLWMPEINERLGRPASRAAREKLPAAAVIPPYGFFVKLGISAPRMVGGEKQKQIVAPQLLLPARPDLNAVRAAYVGNAFLRRAGLWIVEQGKVWRNQWSREEKAPAEYQGNGEEPPPPEFK